MGVMSLGPPDAGAHPRFEHTTSAVAPEPVLRQGQILCRFVLGTKFGGGDGARTRDILLGKPEREYAVAPSLTA